MDSESRGPRLSFLRRRARRQAGGMSAGCRSLRCAGPGDVQRHPQQEPVLRVGGSFTECGVNRAPDANGKLLRNVRIRAHANRSRAQPGCDDGARTRRCRRGLCLRRASSSGAGPWTRTRPFAFHITAATGGQGEARERGFSGNGGPVACSGDGKTLVCPPSFVTLPCWAQSSRWRMRQSWRSTGQYRHPALHPLRAREGF